MEERINDPDFKAYFPQIYRNYSDTLSGLEKRTQGIELIVESNDGTTVINIDEASFNTDFYTSSCT